LIWRNSIRRASGQSFQAASIETNKHDRDQTRILDVVLCDRGIRHGGAREGVRSHSPATTKLLICHTTIWATGEFVLVFSAPPGDGACPMKGLLR
jgi:hypothetical protein